MIDLLKGIVQGDGMEPSHICLKAFDENFEGAINVEWHTKTSNFEAVFYKENIEHIALFDKDGCLLRYQMNLTKDLLPESIKNRMEKAGEIMNVVLINEVNNIQYEVIVRDNKMQRFLYFVSNLGKIIHKKML
jgi:hypothetical protein